MSSNSSPASTDGPDPFGADDTLQTLSDRFEQQVRRYPDRIAIQSPGTALSYDALNRAANRAAHALLDRAGHRHEPVALYCSPGPATLIAALAVLKSGKAFVPIDARLPKAGIKKILAELGARFVLVDRRRLRTADTLTGLRIGVLDIDACQGAPLSANPDLRLSFNAIAHINFTSGTTGEPKGVVWDHHRELFGIRIKTKALGLTPEDRVSLLRANNVGAARDMFLALLNGATLLTLDLDAAGLASLPKWLREHRISVFSCVATVFRHAVRGARGRDPFPGVRLIHIGGEPVFKADVDSYRRWFRDACRFVNRYSISETQAVSYFSIDKRYEIGDEVRVPVGYPLAGSEVSIVDGKGRALGPGEVGEIVVRSPYLALGYWRRPRLTREKFRVDPAGGNWRRYHTGDLGYRLPDDCLVHLGRKDLQAKIRGHRVEISAIEAALHGLASVRQAAVLSERDHGGALRLVAYVVPKSKRAVAERGWRAALTARLPEYMIPGRFMILDRMPVTAGGKIDRDALVAAKRTIPEQTRRVGAPRNPLERALWSLWREVLRVDELRADADFAELGGDSLHAAQIIARVRELFPLRRRLTSLAEVSTVRDLAGFIRAHERADGEAEKIAEVFLRVEKMSGPQVHRALGKLGVASEND